MIAPTRLAITTSVSCRGIAPVAATASHHGSDPTCRGRLPSDCMPAHVAKVVKQLYRPLESDDGARVQHLLLLGVRPILAVVLFASWLAESA